ncbi:ATP-binding cassette domain-containing protein [Streptomyces parvulus]|uniref:ATP-binding cassette domain-containing protein n=1 Tax=Streptomyces parvulus TaxID=146923 RepID=A0A369V1R4_9ACTN|nr:ATP-binding cassette domain-containing protein [Streptomyces parvulus]RDD86155.1 ATP-binding cassette domain-containing protein [Streptomyces parvulus]
MSDVMIEAMELGRTFGATRALDGISFQMEKGRVLCLLGHNGAGKSTLVSILATLLPPTKGTARVSGFDVVREARDVRRRIGLTGQFAAVDESLTGRANLLLVARLLGAGKREAAARAEQLLDMFALTEAADRAAGTYSGGMRRRLDLASSFVGHPQVLFLDEPTTGLDPVSRNALWDLVREVVGTGTTVLLTTQYLEEAEQLADRVMVLARGRCVADGSVTQLKERLGGSTVRATLADPGRVPAALSALRAAGLDPCPGEPAGTVTAPVEGSIGLAAAVRAFDAAGVEITGISLSEPTLDEVYLALAEERAGLPVPS